MITTLTGEHIEAKFYANQLKTNYCCNLIIIFRIMVLILSSLGKTVYLYYGGNRIKEKIYSF